MEWRIKFKIFLMNLLALSCVHSDNNTVIYYVIPSFPQNIMDCPAGYPCNSLNKFGTDEFECLEVENKTVIMILIEGCHTADIKVYNFGCPVNPYTLHIIGNGSETVSVRVHNIQTPIAVKNMILESFMGSNIYLYIDESVHSETTNITITNCIFIKSTMILTNVHLTIKDSNFSDSVSTAIMLFSSSLNIVGHVSFYNNRGYQGGALMLVGAVMNIAREATVIFQENYAENTGGAVFVVHHQMMTNAHDYVSSCFYQLLDYDFNSLENNNFSIQFVNNSAAKGGDHIYGASLESSCVCGFTRIFYTINEDADIIITEQIQSSGAFQQYFSLDPDFDSSISAVSADATRVCICDADGKPQCNYNKAVINIQAYRGEQFSLDVVVVGGDFGTTTGNAYASFLNQNSTSAFGHSDQQHQVITQNSECSVLYFSVYSNETDDILFITTQETLNLIKSAVDYYAEYTECMEETGNIIDSDDSESTKSRHTPLFVNINFLPCPPGFILFGEPPGCNCHPVLIANSINCELNHVNGYHKWNLSNIWVQASNNEELLFSTHCPFSYCKPNGKHVNLGNPDSQCALNRAGILCSSCKANYSLAIGSSRCIHCPNNNNLALLIFFAAAGVLLVFIVAVLNLTVTQGMINGLIFYANLIWAYQSILLPSEFGREWIIHKTFIAWLNLDFGIETCFFRGMNAYSKAWLQFIFPFYTAGLFLLGIRCSSKLSTLFETRSISTLATLLFLSYSKLLRAIIACLQLVIYYTYNDSNVDGSINIVWAIDGNYLYGQHPHIFLLLTAIACFVLLWIPYTLLLFSMQWLRSVDHLGPLKFIGRYKPLYDAYFAPLRDKHHYWFGLLLLSQGLLLLVSSLTLYTLPEISVLILLAVSIFLFCYVISVQPYKHMSVALLESSFMINFIVLAVGYLYFRDNQGGMAILLSVSVTAALVEFCGIVVWNLIPKKLIERFHAKIKRNAEVDSEDVHILEEHHSESEYVSYQESQSIKLANIAAEK